MAEEPLRGRRVLVVEDEYMLAKDLCEQLVAIGAIVVGPAASVESALSLVDRTPPDAAIRDLNLRGDAAYPVADSLTAWSIPFVFTTGYDAGALPIRFHDVSLCEKPIGVAAVMEILARALQPASSSGG